MSDKIRDQLVVFRGFVSREKVLEVYEQTYGRQPEIVHSPEESDTAFWWLGYVSPAEYNHSQPEKTV